MVSIFGICITILWLSWSQGRIEQKENQQHYCEVSFPSAPSFDYSFSSFFLIFFSFLYHYLIPFQCSTSIHLFPLLFSLIFSTREFVLY